MSELRGLIQKKWHINPHFLHETSSLCTGSQQYAHSAPVSSDNIDSSNVLGTVLGDGSRDQALLESSITGGMNASNPVRECTILSHLCTLDTLSQHNNCKTAVNFFGVLEMAACHKVEYNKLRCRCLNRSQRSVLILSLATYHSCLVDIGLKAKSDYL